MEKIRLFLIKNGANNSYVLDITMNDRFNSHRYYYLVFSFSDYEFLYIRSIDLFLRKLEMQKYSLIMLNEQQRKRVLLSIRKIQNIKHNTGLKKNNKVKSDVFTTLADYDLSVLKKIDVDIIHKKEK